jgi:hypothetical protein
VARRRDGQPFGNALDDAIKDRLEKFDDVHGIALLANSAPVALS